MRMVAAPVPNRAIILANAPAHIVVAAVTTTLREHIAPHVPMWKINEERCRAAAALDMPFPNRTATSWASFCSPRQKTGRQFCVGNLNGKGFLTIPADIWHRLSPVNRQLRRRTRCTNDQSLLLAFQVSNLTQQSYQSAWSGNARSIAAAEALANRFWTLRVSG